MIAFIVIAIVTYGTSFIASKSDFVEVGVFSTKFLSSLLLLAVFVLSSIYLDERFDQQKEKSGVLFDTLSHSEDSVSDIAFYLCLLQKASGKDRFSEQSLTEVGHLMNEWINKKIESSQRAIYIGREQPTLAEYRVATLAKPRNRVITDDEIALNSSHKLRNFLHANGAWAYGVACWLAWISEDEYLLFKKEFQAEWDEAGRSEPGQAGRGVAYSRKGGWIQLKRQLEELSDDLEGLGITDNDRVNCLRNRALGLLSSNA